MEDRPEAETKYEIGAKPMEEPEEMIPSVPDLHLSD